MARARLRLNAICPYYTMFPVGFPSKVLTEAKPGDWVLDPFCGRGTTLFAARLRGLGSVGVDVNPVAAALAAAKLVQVDPSCVTRRCSVLIDETNEPEVPEGEFWELAFHQDTLQALCRLRTGLLAAGDDEVDVALRALTLGILHGPLRKGRPTYLSNQMPRTYATKPQGAIRFWRSHALLPPRVDVVDAVRRRADYTFAAVPPKAPGLVRCGDARWEVGFVDRTYDWIVTSPPYLGMRTYLPDQWLRSWFLGGPPDVAYTLPGAITDGTQEAFVCALAEVFAACASRARPAARLAVRFGALPSVPADPGTLITDAVKRAGWTVMAVEAAGVPRRGARQSEQMRRVGSYVEEVDLLARIV